MKLIAFNLVAGLLLLGTASDAAAFGRGAPHGGGGAPHGGGAPRAAPGGHRVGVASGPVGGVHPAARVAPRVETVAHGPVHIAGAGVPHTAFAPHAGVGGAPWGGVHAGGANLGAAHGALGSRAGTVIAPGGYRGGVAIGPRGVGGEGVRLGHDTGYISPTRLRGLGESVRAGRYPYFTRDWYNGRGGIWFPPQWVGGVGPWDVPPWGTLAPFVGITTPPAVFDYGSTTLIQDDTVYQNGDPLGSAADYAAQALALDDAGRAAMPAATDQWQPLGVFGLIQGNETVAQRIFQLAIDGNGVVRGNYYDTVADTTLPVSGALDKTSQRVAWSIGDKKSIVFETGLNNLLQNQTTVLIHYGKNSTQQMVLVRLPDPQGK